MKDMTKKPKENITAPTAGLAVAIMGLLVLALIFGCASQSPNPNGNGNGNSSQNTTIDKTGITTADNKTAYDKTQQTIANALADGNYSEQVQYTRPGGVEIVDFTVTVENNTVTEVSVKPSDNPNNISAKIIGSFATALPDLVIGKKITDIHLPRNVAGSSLTSAAFQQYVDSLVRQ